MVDQPEWPVPMGETPFKGDAELCDECDGRGVVKDWDEWETTCGRCGGYGYVAVRDEDDE